MFLTFLLSSEELGDGEEQYCDKNGVFKVAHGGERQQQEHEKLNHGVIDDFIKNLGLFSYTWSSEDAVEEDDDTIDKWSVDNIFSFSKVVKVIMYDKATDCE